MGTALQFIRFAFNRNPQQPRILWCIKVDSRGKANSEYRCKHASLITRTEVPCEGEFLYAPYSTFTVIRTDWSVTNWSNIKSHYTVVVQASLDNNLEPLDLPL